MGRALRTLLNIVGLFSDGALFPVRGVAERGPGGRDANRILFRVWLAAVVCACRRSANDSSPVVRISAAQLLHRHVPMLIPSRRAAKRLVRPLWLPAAYFAVLTLGVEASYRHLGSSASVVSLATAGLLSTALAIFLGFRVSEAYDRWWEARKLWGAMVNVSRSLGRKITTMIVPERLEAVADEEQAKKAQTEILHRHIAYVNAVRIDLRHGPSVAAAPDAWEEIRPFLSNAEFRSYDSFGNVSTQLLRRQAESLRELFGANAQEELAYLELQRTLDDLYDVQGACERIKNTFFPYGITLSTKVLVWGFASILPFAVLDADIQLDAVEVAFCVAMSLAFVLIEQLGESLKKPFENRPNDTPMTALGRVIEIDLRQMLGETDVPPPLKPVDGVLM